MAGKTTIRELLVRLGVKTDQAKLDAFDRGLTAVKNTAKVVGVAVAGAAYGAFRLAKSIAIAADDTAVAAGRAGLAVEAYQELEFVAVRADMSMQELSAAMRVQSKFLYGIKEGGKEAADTLRAMGLTVRDLPVDDQLLAFDALVKGIRGVKSETAQMAIAQKVWGRGGTALIPLIRDQSLSISALRKEAHKLGYIMDAETIKAGQEFDDAFKDAGLAARGLKIQIGSALIPVFTQLMGKFTSWVVLNKDMVKVKVDEWFKRVERTGKDWIERMGGAEEAMNKLITAGKVFIAIWGAGKIIGIISTVTTALNGLKVALTGVLIPMLPLIAVVSVAAVVFGAWGLVIQDLVVYFRGGNSAIGEFIDRNKEANTVVGNLAKTVEYLLSLIGMLSFDKLKDAFASHGGLLGTMQYGLGRTAAMITGAPNASTVATPQPPVSKNSTFNAGGVHLSGMGMSPGEVDATVRLVNGSMLQLANASGSGASH